MTTCSYFNPFYIYGPDGNELAFQFASSSCDYSASAATSTVMSTFTYGEIIIGTFSFLTLCLALYAFFWFTVRGVKIKRQ